ncbi:MAG TPA: 4Fe-4S dicluster domain-containing protein [Acidimicrobiales bacterium]|nr:4Fe-4S dicluster domain-containing protein [Acidimicrobiales bacterium]
MGERREVIEPEEPWEAQDPGDPAAPGQPRLLTRREVTGALAGCAAGALVLGGLHRSRFADPTSGGTAAQAAGDPDGVADAEATPVRYGMVLDLTRCDGCLACVEACRDENGLSDGVLWPYVFAYREPDDDRTAFLLRVCQQCADAPCIKVCPTTARHRRPSDGLVLTDYDLCIGCRYCEVACPYGVNYFQWGDPETYGGEFEGDRRDARGVSVEGDPPLGVMGKCNYCPQRQDDPELRGTTACSIACTMKVIHVGDMNDPDSEPNRYLAQRREESGGSLPTFRLLEELGTEPNVVYIGSPPSSRATLVEGPVAYEEVGLVEERRTVLEGPAPWFERIGASS